MTGEPGGRPPLLLGSQGLFTMHGWKGPLQKQPDKSAELPGSVDKALPTLSRTQGLMCVLGKISTP